MGSTFSAIGGSGCCALGDLCWLGWFSLTSQGDRNYDGGQQDYASEYEDLILLDQAHQAA